MHFLILGKGKTGTLVAEVARQRHHRVEALGGKDNPDAVALTDDRLHAIDVVIDFTAPRAVVPNIHACLRARKNMVVGTTGWYSELPALRAQVETTGAGFLYGANFSIGVNIFFEAARAAAEASKHGYLGQIFERHHVHKTDAPSGTALILQRVVKSASEAEPEITSFREGEVVGMHELVFDSPCDRIYLCHDAKSRRGFAEGAVLAAEWLAGRKGFFEFKDVWREL